jgi:hypothetical protein
MCATRDGKVPPRTLPPKNASQSRTKREAAIAASLRRTFEALVEQLGPDAAKRAWRMVLRPNAAPAGRPAKTVLLNWEKWYLEFHHEMANDPDESISIGHMARFFYETNKRAQHHSRAALEKKLRRLIEEKNNGLIVRDESPEGRVTYKRVPRSRGH